MTLAKRGSCSQQCRASALIVLAMGCLAISCGERVQCATSLPNATSNMPTGAVAGNITTQRLLSIDKEPQSWLTGGRDWQQTYYSPLTRITPSNVATLGYAWGFDLQTTHGLEATPIVVDGVMYVSAPWGFVHALDARSGQRLWTFDPKVDGTISAKVCCGVVNRGLAVASGRVFVASIDGRLFALDARTGKVAWHVDTIVDHTRGYTVTGAVYVAGDVAVIGNSGAELDARGYVSAYALRDGKLRWRFFTVPASGNGPFEHPDLVAAARTWDANSRWDVGGGGTVWDGMAYDPALDLLYVGTGNAALYPRKLRSPGGGDNLYLSSILAIRPKTGRLAWYYQTTPGDQWDFTAVQKMILADVSIGGRERQVLMQAPKNGFFYVIDRGTGGLISAEPYATVTWASRVDKTNGRPVESAQADYAAAPKLVFPGPQGGHNWQPMAFNPKTGLVYIPVIEGAAVFWMPKEAFKYERGGLNTGVNWVWTAVNAGDWGWDAARVQSLPSLQDLGRGQPDTKTRGFLRAWDPRTSRIVWQIETSEGWAGEINAMWNGGGVMTTATGLVFQGRSTGLIHVYAADDGKPLASIDIGTSIMAAPMTYEIDGVQYVAVMAGFGGGLGGSYPPGTAAYRYGNAGRIVVLKPGGGAVPRPKEVDHSTDFPHPALERFGTPALIAQGQALFERHCAICHRNNAATGTVPDLRRMSAQTHADFRDIVLGGIRAAKGMGSFAQLLSVDDVNALQAAILDAAWKQYELEHPQPHTPQAPTSQERETSNGR